MLLVGGSGVNNYWHLAPAVINSADVDGGNVQCVHCHGGSSSNGVCT